MGKITDSYNQIETEGEARAMLRIDPWNILWTVVNLLVLYLDV